MTTFRLMQIGLRAAELYTGRVDGVFGPDTTAAAMAYAGGCRRDYLLEERARPLAQEMEARGMTTPQRVAHFLATLCHESGGWSRDQENLHYTDPVRLDRLFSAVNGVEDAKALIKAGAVAIGNRIYANRLGNGDESSGDGYRYRGRTDAQLTGRDNYAAMGAKLSLDLLSDPDQVLTPELSARVAGQFWNDHGCNRFADLNQPECIRIRWNGDAMEGLRDVVRITEKLLRLGM